VESDAQIFWSPKDELNVELLARVFLPHFIAVLVSQSVVLGNKHSDFLGSLGELTVRGMSLSLGLVPKLAPNAGKIPPACSAEHPDRV
jgi:hypothetical protein